MQGYPCKICGDFPVNSQLITCKSYILFNAISTCVPKVRNYGDFRQHVIPTVITCLLRGTPCDTGFSYTFYRGNICSVYTRYGLSHFSKFSNGKISCLEISLEVLDLCLPAPIIPALNLIIQIKLKHIPDPK